MPSPLMGVHALPSMLSPMLMGVHALHATQSFSLINHINTSANNAFISGSWFDPNTDGEGWEIQVLSETSALVYWYTYDANGNQAWNLGVGEISQDLQQRLTLTVDTVSPIGTHFGDNFVEAEIQNVAFGNLQFTFQDCADAIGSLNFTSASDQSLTRNLQRITSIVSCENSP